MKMNINELSYEQLCLLIDSEYFYDFVDSKEKVELYVNLLHRLYCKENNMRASSITFINGLSSNTYGYYNPIENKIYLNSKFLEVFNNCKENKNVYYPYALLSTIIHESRHKWQHNNINKMFSSNTSYREKISLYATDKKRYEAMHAQKLKIKEDTKKYTGRQLIKIVKTAFLVTEFELEYDNSPTELDAEEEVISILKKVYETTLSENSLNILLNYVEKKRTGGGLWFLSHEYYEDKEHPYRKRAFKVVKDVYMDFLNRSIEKHKQGIHSYHEEDYLFSLYPSMNEIIEKIRESNADIPNKIQDYLVFEREFHNKPKSLPVRR